MRIGGGPWLLRRRFPPNPGKRDGNLTRILVTGSSGLLGNKIVEHAIAKGHEVYATYQHNPPRLGVPLVLDQTIQAEVEKVVSLASPDAIVNSAALTDVDVCEELPEMARFVNSISVSHLASSASAHKAFLVQVSTDYVFSGEKGMYSETDPPSPVNEYGRSKLEGEEMARLAGEGNWCVARASVVYGWGRPQRGNAATYVYDKLSKGEQIRMVQDQYCSPTYNDNLARMILEIVEKRVLGVMHTSGATRITRYDFAVLIAKTLGLDTSLIRPVESASIPWKAKRPRDSSLDVQKCTGLLDAKPMSAIEGAEGFRTGAKAQADQVV